MIDFILQHSAPIALVGFFLGFVFIVFTVLRPSRRAEIESHAMIPLKEQE